MLITFLGSRLRSSLTGGCLHVCTVSDFS